MNAVTELPFRQPLSAGTSVGPTDNSPGPVPPDMLAQVREIAAGPLAAAAE